VTEAARRRVDVPVAQMAARFRTVTTTKFSGSGAFEALLGPALEQFLALGEADVAVIQRYGRHALGPAPRRHVWRANGSAGDNFKVTERLSLQHPELHPTVANLVLPPALQRRSFVEDQAIWDRDAFESSAFFQKIFVPSGLSYQLRLLAYDGTRLLGWIGLARLHATRPFHRDDRQRLQPLVTPVLAAMLHADRCEAASAPDVVGDLVVDARGHIEFASKGGQAWLQQPAFLHAVRASVTAFDRGDGDAADLLLERGNARLLRLDGDNGHVRYLVHVTPTPVASASSSSLTPMQQSVAERAALGMTIDEVANELQISAHTARSHLKEAYRRLHVATRVELADALRDR